MAGLVVSGYGFSTMVMNPITLAITNPNNVAPVKVEGYDDKYFTDEDVLSRKDMHINLLTSIMHCQI